MSKGYRRNPFHCSRSGGVIYKSPTPSHTHKIISYILSIKTSFKLFLHPVFAIHPLEIAIQSPYIYTLSGQLIKSYHMASGEKLIDFSAMPTGMYKVRAKSDEDYFSVRDHD